MSTPEQILNVSLLDPFCETITDEGMRARFREQILSIPKDADGNFFPDNVRDTLKNGGETDLGPIGLSFLRTAAETARESTRGLLSPDEDVVDSDDLEVALDEEVVDPEDDVLDPERRAKDVENRVSEIEEGALDPEMSL